MVRICVYICFVGFCWLLLVIRFFLTFISGAWGPLSNMSLICDVTWMLTEAWDYPQDFHRVMGMLTDLIEYVALT